MGEIGISLALVVQIKYNLIESLSQFLLFKIEREIEKPLILIDRWFFSVYLN